MQMSIFDFLLSANFLFLHKCTASWDRKLYWKKERMHQAFLPSEFTYGLYPVVFYISLLHYKISCNNSTYGCSQYDTNRSIVSAVTRVPGRKRDREGEGKEGRAGRWMDFCGAMRATSSINFVPTRRRKRVSKRGSMQLDCREVGSRTI